MRVGTGFEIIPVKMKNLMKMSHNITKAILSKTSLKAIVVVMMALNFSGCSEFLRGKPKAQDYIEVKNNNLGCEWCKKPEGLGLNGGTRRAVAYITPEI